MYDNVKGVLGLNYRNGQARNLEQLKIEIKERELSECSMESFDDSHGDCIWCIFFTGELEDDVETVLSWIIDNDEKRFW